MTELFRRQLGSTGPRVVFLHGLFGQGRNWTSLAKELSSRARITLVDLPNHGRSGWTAQFSYPGMADDLAARLGEQSAGEPYAVVGHSMGGKTAMLLALRHPELVARLCVVDVSPVSTAELSSFRTYVQGMRSVDLATLADRASADQQLTPFVPEPTIRSFLLQNLRRDGGRWRWQMNLELLGDSLPVLGDWPDVGEPAYPGPVLWVAGTQSSYIRPEYAPAMRALFPRLQLLKIKGAGHWVHSDQPQVFSAALHRFLNLSAGATENLR